jgi:hypothetical protein
LKISGSHLEKYSKSILRIFLTWQGLFCIQFEDFLRRRIGIGLFGRGKSIQWTCPLFLATFSAKVLHRCGIKYEPKSAAIPMSGIRFLFRPIGNIQFVTAVL